MALVQQYLTPADWALTEKVANKRATMEYLRYVVPWGRYQLPQQGRDWARQSTPWLMYVAVTVMERLFRRSFRKLESAAFGASA